MSQSNSVLQLSYAVIWLLTFRAMLTCFELLSAENVNASKWVLINYPGKYFTPARSYIHKHLQHASQCLLCVQYIRWLVQSHKQFWEEGRCSAAQTGILGRSASGEMCFYCILLDFLTMLPTCLHKYWNTGLDIHGPQRMNLTDFAYLSTNTTNRLTFLVGLSQFGTDIHHFQRINPHNLGMIS